MKLNLLAQHCVTMCVSILNTRAKELLSQSLYVGTKMRELKRSIGTLNPETIPFVSDSYVKKCLSRHNLLYEDGYTCISVLCPLCKNTDNSLHINKISGFCICNSCKKSGEWRNLEGWLIRKEGEREYVLQPEPNMTQGIRHWTGIFRHSTPVSSLAQEDVHRLLYTLQVEASLEDLESLGCRVDLSSQELYVPLKNGQVVVGYKKLSEDKEEDEATYPEQSACGLIVGRLGSDTGVIVATLRDLIALLKSRIPHTLVCLPHGEQNLPQEVLPLFEHYKKLVLWFNNSPLSWDSMRTFAKKLYDQRCYLVRPSENQPRPWIALKEGYNLVKIVDKAQPISHAAITTFAQLRDDVLSELCNIDKVTGVKWTRFPQLNSILKGHRRGELTVLTGPTGSGKTTFMSEYSLDLAMQQVTTLWGSFEIRNQRLARTMLQQYVKEDLEKNLDKFNSWADSFQRLPIYFMTFHGQQSLELVMEAVEHATYVHDVAHVVIDNVQFMLGLSSTETGFLDRFYRQDALIAAFRNFATMHNVHVTLVIHPRKEREGEQLTTSSIFGGAKASQEADNVLIIQHKTLQSLRTKKFLQIAKNRYTGDLGVMTLDFDRTSLSFGKKKEM